jgi:regulator of replication initiation timing
MWNFPHLIVFVSLDLPVESSSTVVDRREIKYSAELSPHSVLARLRALQEEETKKKTTLNEAKKRVQKDGGVAMSVSNDPQPSTAIIIRLEREEAALKEAEAGVILDLAKLAAEDIVSSARTATKAAPIMTNVQQYTMHPAAGVLRDHLLNAVIDENRKLCQSNELLGSRLISSPITTKVEVSHPRTDVRMLLLENRLLKLENRTLRMKLQMQEFTARRW